MQSLLVLMLVFNVMAIQNGPSRPHDQGSHRKGYKPPNSEEVQDSREDENSNVDDSQGNILNFPNATENRHHSLQRHQSSYWEDHHDQGYGNTGDDQDSSVDDTSTVTTVDGSKGNNSLIFPNMSDTTVVPTIVKYGEAPIVDPSMDAARSPPAPKPFKPRPHYPTTQSTTISPSLQQRPQVAASQNANGTPHSTATPSLSSPQKPLNNPSSQPESSVISQSSPDIVNECVCTPFFRCHDKETSSNLTNVVNDRTFIPASACQITEKTCPNSNDICCCNMEPPSSSTAKSLSQSQAIIPSEISTSNDKCDCRPSHDCHDYIEMDRTLEKGNCKEPNHVCCHDHVLPITTPSIETSTLSSTPQHQSPIPSQVSQSASTGECTCTPFFKCYDPETSSNLTNVVNDRINRCPSSNDVCCYNLSPPSGVTETKEGVKDTTIDCTGPCILIEHCPKLTETLEAAQSGNSEATKKLRKSVCSKKNGLLHVCC